MVLLCKTNFVWFTMTNLRFVITHFYDIINGELLSLTIFKQYWFLRLRAFPRIWIFTVVLNLSGSWQGRSLWTLHAEVAAGLKEVSDSFRVIAALEFLVLAKCVGSFLQWNPTAWSFLWQPFRAMNHCKSRLQSRVSHLHYPFGQGLSWCFWPARQQQFHMLLAL